MILQKQFQLQLAEPSERLLTPEIVFSGKPPFGVLERDGSEVSGMLLAEVPLFGDLKFPFKSRIEALDTDRAKLEAIPLEPAPPFWAELSGTGQLEATGIRYKLQLRIHAHLPEGEKWGGKALQRMAEAAFDRAIDRVLLGFGQ